MVIYFFYLYKDIIWIIFQLNKKEWGNDIVFTVYEEKRREQEKAINFNIGSGKEEKEEEDNQSIIILKEFLNVLWKK